MRPQLLPGCRAGGEGHGPSEAFEKTPGKIAGKGLAACASKQQLLEMKIAESLVEADDFDLIAMGRPEGPRAIAMPTTF